MSSKSSNLHPDTAFEVQCKNRWQVYHRLQELDIPCWCRPYQPLKVQIESPTAMIQFWSVMRQTKTPFVHQRQWLERCWSLRLKN